MSQVKVKENESLDSALRRFKRQTSRDGVIQEVRKREHYEKPSVKRKKKSEAARKRKYTGFVFKSGLRARFFICAPKGEPAGIGGKERKAVS